jgi:hypothetical protein
VDRHRTPWRTTGLWWHCGGRSGFLRSSAEHSDGPLDPDGNVLAAPPFRQPSLSDWGGAKISVMSRLVDAVNTGAFDAYHTEGVAHYGHPLLVDLVAVARGVHAVTWIVP